MAPRRKGEKRTRHGTRSLILKVFQSEDAPSSLRTTAIVERVSQIAGTAIPPFSVYSALRTLVKRKVLKAGRQGHEKSYSLAGTPDSSSATSFAASTAPAMARPASIPEPTAMPALEAVAMPSAPAGMPHKLAVGEALILHVGDEHVESVTNVHGRLVVERHPRSK